VSTGTTDPSAPLDDGFDADDFGIFHAPGRRDRAAGLQLAIGVLRHIDGMRRESAVVARSIVAAVHVTRGGHAADQQCAKRDGEGVVLHVVLLH